MKLGTISRIPFALAALVAVGSVSPAAAAGPGYHDHASLTGALRDIASRNSKIASLTSIGKSLEDRDLWLLTLGEPGPGKPAIYLDAAHDGSELTTTEVLLGVVRRLVEGLPPDSLAAFLSQATVHVLPRANPDAAERAFANPPRVQAWIPRPDDDDRDGQVDEDGPEDLDGDGAIAWMRVEDPAGEWTIDPVDARILVKRKPDDPGPFYRRYAEGVDDDGDDLVNEDPEGGVALLHNFPQGWEMKHLQPGAGPYAASELETVAILEHFVAHPEIAAVLTLGQSDRPEKPGAGTPGFMPEPDAISYARLDAILEKAIGHKPKSDQMSPGPAGLGGAGQLRASAERGSPAPPAPRAVVPGSFLEWAYFQTGAFAFSPQVWANAPAGADSVPGDSLGVSPVAPDSVGTGSIGEGPGSGVAPGAAGAAPDTAGVAPDAARARERAWFRWMDREMPDAFRPFAPHAHPTLGDVQIGGVIPLRRTSAPQAVIDSLAADVADLVLSLGPTLGRVAIVELAAEPAAAALRRVRVTVENTGRLPTISARGAATRFYHPILAEIALPGGAKLVDSPLRVALGILEPGARRSAEWLVDAGRGGAVTVRVWSARAGASERTIALDGGGD